ncbi:hypothetical protein dsat_1887 [Alkalidesulfovibrio alkalitolerans DSM 16529]|jgi:surface carbohydrate biosynthesis protein|uniref:Uncharacterized protein n=1 Tax=Alkalidesulfovibrio alkalitolerans DSM 16529 TaxID=1121439 RepID=S7TFL8_9BACT|nr:surface carbohydrate biosynthesis protein [Alkalidesulfovibrio alkalitolerans]EPR35546.1 hypothetical protein dsat_1887 [Alkalidesulfovibrio alkalitolerans DSM 16529]
MASPCLYIPVETKVREFDAKTLLACFAAEAGFEVVLGGQMELMAHMPLARPGFYLEKGIAPTRLEAVEQLCAAGHKVVSWCEEGLVTLDPSVYVRDRVSAELLDRLTFFCAWGDEHSNIITEAHPRFATKIVRAGNPRFDILREPFNAVFADRVRELRSRFGDFILVNTNFGFYNNFLGESFFLEKMMRGHGRITGPEHERFLTGMLDHIKGCFEAFAEAVPALAALFPDRTIVLRPHPSENHDRWREIVEGVRNVTVVHEGNVVPWLMACSALVHNSCTTAVEMAALGRRAVAYRPRVSEDFEPALPALVSESAFTLDQLKTAVAVAVQGADTFAGGEPLLEHYVSGYQGKYSCEILVSALWRAARDAGPSSWRVGQRLRWHSRSSYQRILHAVSRLMGRQDRLEAYKKQKFPGLEEAEVRALIALYANASGRFGSLGVSGMPNVPRAVRIRAQDSEGGVRAASV